MILSNHTTEFNNALYLRILFHRFNQKIVKKEVSKFWEPPSQALSEYQLDVFLPISIIFNIRYLRLEWKKTCLCIRQINFRP